MSKKKPTPSKVAADILTTFIIHTWEGVTQESCDKFYDEVYKRYDLCNDPFTTLPCTREEWADSNVEYQRQTMEQKYGYWED